MMPWRFHQLPAVFCRFCCLVHHRSCLTRKVPSKLVFPTSKFSVVSWSQPLPIILLFKLDHLTAHSHGSIVRPLSTEAASHGKDARDRKKPNETTEQPNSGRRGPHGREARQSSSGLKRYTSREPEAEIEEQETEDEADTFGTLSNAHFSKRIDTSIASLELDVTEEDMDWKRERRRKNSPHWYGTRMEKLVKKGKLAEAIDFLEQRMLKLDHVQPTEYNYDVLIGACGRAGYTEKAFKLYNRMKERGLHPSGVTYTSLFNACSESPWPLTDGYERLKKLHQQLKEKDIQVNLITAHSMIKAYGKCGDIEGAFHIFHHLLSSGTVVARSFASLLMACASNREAGFTYAIEAWRQMLARGLQPDGYCFNLLLRVVRDCGIGNPDTAAKILLKPVTANDAHLLDSGLGKKGKGRRGGRTDKAKREGVSKSTDGSQKNTDEMIQLPAALIRDVGESVSLPNNQDPVESRGTGNLVDSVSALGDEEGSRKIWQSSPAEDTSDRDILDGDDNWQTSEVERDVWKGGDSTGGVGNSGGKIEHRHWWEEPEGVVENQNVTLREQVLPLDLGWREDSVVLTLPNLLDQDADFENVESLTVVRTPSDRLSLIGGLEGVLQKMKENGVKPDVKTFSLLTDLVPMTTEDEDKLLAYADELDVALDVDFYNMIIHRRTKRRDLERAKEAVSVMRERGLHPNVRTFANLAIGCATMTDGLELLKEIENSDLKSNVVVFGALMGAAFKNKSYSYIRKLMACMKESDVEPNKRIIELLEEAATINTAVKQSENLHRRVKHFRGFYYKWLAETEAAEDPHPWEAFRTVKKRVEEEQQLAE